MGKIAEHPVTKILNLLKPLSDDEKRIIYDHCRPAPKPRSKPKPERKPSQKRKAGKEAIAGSDGGKHCWKCGLPIDANIHQLPTHPNYHGFVASVEPAGEAKGASV